MSVALKSPRHRSKLADSQCAEHILLSKKYTETNRENTEHSHRITPFLRITEVLRALQLIWPSTLWPMPQNEVVLFVFFLNNVVFTLFTSPEFFDLVSISQADVC